MSKGLLGKAYVEVRAKMDGLEKDFQKGLGAAEKQMMGTGQRLQATGAKMTRTLTPAALAVGAVFRQAFNEYDAGADTIIAKTGATGDTLKGLEGVMKAVAGSTRSGFAEVGAVVGDLNTALGITGKPLENMTRQVIQLQELGEQFDPQLFTRALGDWSISAEDSAGALDRLYKIAQISGVGLSGLMETVVQFGAPMRQLGFTFDEATLLLGKWQKEGVNTETIMAGMKMGLGNIAKAQGASAENAAKLTMAQEDLNAVIEEHGEDSEEAALAQGKLDDAMRSAGLGAGDVREVFRGLIQQMKDAETQSEANTIANEVFGKRAGPDLAAAVREGRFELESMEEAMGDHVGSVDKAYQATLDWSDRLGMLKDRVYGVIGPVGEFGMAFAGIAMAAGPVVSGIGWVITKLTAQTVATTAATASTGALAASQGVAGATAAASSGGFFAAAAGIWAMMAPILAVIAIIAVIGLAIWALVAHWDTLKKAAGIAWDWIWDKIKWVGDAIVFLFQNFSLPGLLMRHWDTIMDGVGRAVDWVTDRWSGLVDWFGNLPGWVGDIFWGVADAIFNPFSWAMDGIRSLWNSTIGGFGFSVPSWVPGIGGNSMTIPYLANGGNVRGSGFAVVGERGPEKVWLGAGASVEPLSRSGRGGGDGDTWIVNNYAPIGGVRDFADELDKVRSDRRYGRGKR